MAQQKCGAGPKLYKGILRRAEHALAIVMTIAIGKARKAKKNKIS